MVVFLQAVKKTVARLSLQGKAAESIGRLLAGIRGQIRIGAAISSQLLEKILPKNKELMTIPPSGANSDLKIS
ncbi:hypothetical protein [Marinilabilia salmonicolor]|uniref:hypothetical protein n=1 Tax=Marinilabilia salmonicolor TaxID=989 RepID=UPI00029AD6E0|nr:hypothetical protein [Marinilabilia salmonicolor]